MLVSIQIYFYFDATNNSHAYNKSRSFNVKIKIIPQLLAMEPRTMQQANRLKTT